MAQRRENNLLDPDSPQFDPEEFARMQEDNSSISVFSQSHSHSTQQPESQISQLQQLQILPQYQQQVQREQLQMPEEQQQNPLINQRQQRRLRQQNQRRRSRERQRQRRRGLQPEQNQPVEQHIPQRRHFQNRTDPQNIWQQKAQARMTKNFSIKLRDVITKALNRIGRQNLVVTQIWNSLEGFIEFIRRSNLNPAQIEQLIDLPRIYDDIEANRRIGRSRKFNNFSRLRKELLTYMYKEILKIIYQSVKRMIPLILNDRELEVRSFLDQQAQEDLRVLGQNLSQHAMYSHQYNTLVGELQ